MPRLFVAALPDAATVRTLRALPRPPEPGIRWVAEQNWHVTLRFIGDAEVERVAELLEGPCFHEAEAILGPTVEWLGRSLVIPVVGLDTLAATVRRATEPIGQNDSRPFRGHLTIARAGREASSCVPGSEVSGRFAVRHIALVESELHPTGAVYRTVTTFPAST